MKLMKTLAVVLLLTMLASLPLTSLAADAYGSAAVVSGQTYTLEQMLTLALQDEYMAQAEYNAIQNTYGADAPFSNIVKAEGTHIALLTTLFDTYDLTLPVNDAAAKVTAPATVEDAYTTGIAAENANISMYEVFLAQTTLPEDVRSVFTVLQNASKNHLTAFTRNSENNGMGMQYGRNSATQSNGRGNRGMGSNTGTLQNGGNNVDCPLFDGVAATCVGCGGRNMGGSNRTN